MPTGLASGFEGLQSTRDWAAPIQSTGDGHSVYELESFDTIDQKETVASWRSLFAFTDKQHALSITCAIIITVSCGVIKPAAAFFYGKIFAVLALFGGRQLDGHDTLQQISTWCVALTILGVLAWLVNGALLSSWMVFGELQAKSVREKMFIGLLDKDMEWYDLREDGISSLLTRIQTQIRELQLAVSQPLGFLLFELVGALSAFGLAFYSSWKLTLVILATFPVSMITLWVISRGLGQAIEDQKRELTIASKHANTAVKGIDTVKAFNAQEHETWQYLFTIKKVTIHYLSQVRINALQTGVTRFVLVGIFVQGFWYGIHLVNQGLSPGNVLTAFYACLIAAQSVDTILPQWLVLTKGMSAGETLKSIMDHVYQGRKITNMAGHLKPNSCQGDVELNWVSFAYPSNSRQLVLDKATFFFPAGETTFVVGKSGSGKSTVGNLLMKYYEPLSGEILIDGHAIQTLDPQWLRQNITLVQQESILFNGTILENIALGRRDHTTQEDIVKACDTACLQETINALPDGLDTVVGLNARALSGGQSQRVSIARSRLRDSPILILDESTSALDQKGRLDVVEAIREWRKGKTTIIITHDLSQIMDNDYVYVLDDSKVVQEGYRRQLADKSHGTFAAILREADNTRFSEARRNSEPASPTFADDTQILEESPRRWNYISRAFRVQEAHSDTRGITHGHNRLSLGASVLQANAILEETLWSSPAIYESPEIPESQSPPFSTPRQAPRIPSPALVRKEDDGIFSDHRYPGSPRSGLTCSPLTIDTSIASPSLSVQKIQAPEPAPPSPVEKAKALPPASLTKIFRTVWPTLSNKERIIFISGFIAAIMVAAGTPAFAVVFGHLLNTFYTKENQVADARKWALILLGIAVMDGITTFWTHYALEYCGQAWINSLRLEALKRILAQQKSWFDKEENSATKISDCFDRNAEEMRNLVGRFAGLVVTVVVMLIITVIWSFILAWNLTLVALACVPVVFGITRAFDYVSIRWEEKCNDAAEFASSIFSETFSNIRIVRALTLENYFERKHRRATADTYKDGLKRSIYTGMLFGLVDSMAIFITAAVFYYAARLVTTGRSLSNILQVCNLLLLGISNAMNTMGMIPQISSSRATATHMLYLASLPLDGSHESQGTTRLSTPLPIRMQNLSFTYPNQSAKTLDRVSLCIKAGTCTAIVGPSGSGKSTIASLLLGLYPPDVPTDFHSPPPLTFNGRCITKCKLTNLRSYISYVQQTPLIFPASVYENIIYGLPESSKYRTYDHAQRAASQAGIHSFIISLEQGYNTLIGEGGMGLSGGQTQRIAIARALIRKPEVLILDEATSALDGESAEGIRETVKYLTGQGVAVVCISHNIDMMRAADHLVVIENGRVAEMGSFEGLKGRDLGVRFWS